MSTTVASPSVRPPLALTLTCATAALVTVGVGLWAGPDPVRMPVAPWPVPAAAASLGALLTMVWHRTSDRVRTAVGATAAAGMLAGCVAATPHTVLILVVWLATLVTGGAGPFTAVPTWPSTAAHLVSVAAAVGLAVWVVRPWWQRYTPSRAFLTGTAAVSVAGCLPYGLLKLDWAFGGRIGLIGHAFDDVGFFSPGFGDTVVLTAVSLVVSVLMGLRRTGPVLRPALIGVGGLGSLMLLPVAAVTVVDLVPILLGLSGIDDDEVAPWAFLMVYGSFAVWGLGLVALTIGYTRSTSGLTPCRRRSHSASR